MMLLRWLTWQLQRRRHQRAGTGASAGSISSCTPAERGSTVLCLCTSRDGSGLICVLVQQLYNWAYNFIR